MDYVYIIVALLAIYAECSGRINTKNILRKIGLLFIVSGALLSIYHYDNNLIQLGGIIYITVDISKELWIKLRHREQLH